MSAAENFAEVMAVWAQREPSVQGLVLVGSQVRAADDPVWSADAHSDWDFQIITSQPRMFADAAWLRGLLGAKLRAYAVRAPRLGSVPKVNAVMAGTEADFVIIPSRVLTPAKFAVGLGLHRGDGRLRSSLQNLAIIIRPGWRFLKGAEKWEPFYRRLVAEVADQRLGDDEARRLAAGFACDYVGIRRKIARGELRAAQRMIHRDLAELNFRLLHELRLRAGERTFPEARRIERVVGETDLAAVTVETGMNAATLQAATEKCAATCRELMGRLVGPTWRWPEVG